MAQHIPDKREAVHVDTSSHFASFGQSPCGHLPCSQRFEWALLFMPGVCRVVRFGDIYQNSRHTIPSSEDSAFENSSHRCERWNLGECLGSVTCIFQRRDAAQRSKVLQLVKLTAVQPSALYVTEGSPLGTQGPPDCLLEAVLAPLEEPGLH